MRFGTRLLFMHALAMAASPGARLAAQAVIDTLQKSGRWDSGYAHGFGGNRRKLKRSRQDHQRNVSPSRRHG